MDLTKLPKSSTNSLVFQQHVFELKTNYTNYISINTDGSKNGTSVTSAAIINKHTISRILPDGMPVFSAEAKAIELALQHVKHCNIAKVIIFSDSLSCLQAIKNCQLKNPFILDILELHISLTKSKIIFCWLPGHVGIKGNTLADAAAKAAHTAPISRMSIPYSDSKHAVSSYIKLLRQEKWNNESHNKLHHFQPLIGITPLSGVYCRQDETVLRRCCIGHTFYTHSYILKGEDRPRCVGCDEDITVKHILLDCVDFSDQRLRFYFSPNLKHLFIQVPGHQILSFLKAIGLYGKFLINYHLHQTINSYT